MSRHLLACQRSVGSTSSFSLTSFFFSSCLLKVHVHKIFRGSSSEDGIAYSIAPVQVYCATETDILPPEKSKELMGWNYCTRSSPSDWQSGLDPHLRRQRERQQTKWANTQNRSGPFCMVLRRNVTFQNQNQKYERSACFWSPSWGQLTLFYLLFSSQWKEERAMKSGIQMHC